MSKKGLKRQQKRITIAEVLYVSLQRQADAAVARLEAIADRLSADNPDLAERVDRIVARAIARAEQMPEAITALYLETTQEPPEIIEGEVIEVEAGKEGPRPVTKRMVSDGR